MHRLEYLTDEEKHQLTDNKLAQLHDRHLTPHDHILMKSFKLLLQNSSLEYDSTHTIDSFHSSGLPVNLHRDESNVVGHIDFDDDCDSKSNDKQLCVQHTSAVSNINTNGNGSHDHDLNGSSHARKFNI